MVADLKCCTNQKCNIYNYIYITDSFLGEKVGSMKFVIFFQLVKLLDYYRIPTALNEQLMLKPTASFQMRRGSKRFPNKLIFI